MCVCLYGGGGAFCLEGGEGELSVCVCVCVCACMYGVCVSVSTLYMMISFN